MDTGNYMANQMDNLISAALQEREEFEDKLWSEIATYIKECGYTWQVRDIVDEYCEKYTKGFYTSFSAKQVIKHFEERLKKLYQ